MLTLVNPAYMTRQVHEMASKAAGVIGHITSLNPIRPKNAPDKWEVKALEAFERGDAEVSSVEKMGGIEYLRLMQPLFTEKGCLQCHSEQHYRVGDIRGGISISIPTAPFVFVEHANIVRSSIAHGLLWLFGLAFVGFEMQRLNQQLRIRHRLSKNALIESEAKYRRIFNASVAAIYIVDTDKYFLDSNQAGLDLLGYTREELLGMRVPYVYGDPDGVFAAHAQLLKGRKAISYEHRLKRKDGRVITVLSNSVPILDADGNVIGIQSTLIDITLRKQAEQELRENQTFLTILIKALPDLVWLKDPDGVYLAFNSRFQRFFGKAEKDIIGKTDYDFMGREQADAFRYHDKRAIEKAAPSINEEEVTYADDGHREILETIKTPIYTEAGRLMGVLGIARDITERKLKEKIQAAKLRLIEFSATHASVELLQNFLDEAEALTNSSIGFYHFVDEDQKTLSHQTWSTNTLNNACHVEGAPKHAALTQAGVWADCVKQRRPAIHNDYARLEHQKGMPPGHVPVTRELVVPVIRNHRIQAIFGVGNKTTAYTSNDVDIIEQFAELSWETINYERARDAQRESEERYRSMMEAMNDAAFICSPDFHIEYLNPAMARRIGRDATGEICHQAINHLDECCPWCAMDTIQQGASLKTEVKSPLDGRYYQVSNSPIQHRDGVISKMAIYTDITQIKGAEERLRQAQKMESLGNLAGGIAHDFNNILSPIIGLSELLMMDLPEGGFEREHVNGILKSAKRASDLVQQILSFSRQSEKKRIPIRIQQILKEVFKLMRSTIPSNIPIKRAIQVACGQVLADPTQIHQIVMNLVTNAFHAVEENDGEIALSLREVTIDKTMLTGSMLEPGQYAVISVSDTGCGIEPAILEKIFEPYFTTKKPGKGTGLGLSVVYGIVKDHGGDIRVTSPPGEGTTFDIYLPIIEAEDENDHLVDKDEHQPGGNEHILLVDDEEPVVKVEKIMLERLGYRVTTRVSSMDALYAFKARPHAFDLVISDMTMPNMTGDQLSRAMLEIRPGMPIVICTGFSERIDKQKADAIGIKGFLKKPVIKSKMAEMVRTILDEAQGQIQP